MTNAEQTTQTPPLTAIEAWAQDRVSRRLSVRLADSEAGWFFMYMRGALEDTALEKDDGSDYTLELKIEGGQAVVLYADLIDDLTIRGDDVEIAYRGGNLEIQAERL